MDIIVRIPAPLRTLTGGKDEVPAAGDRLCDEKGVRRFVNIYVGDEDTRFAGGLKAAIKTGDEISIVPAIAGGR